MAHAETDPFDELRTRIRATADAAERLSFEAAAGTDYSDGDATRRARAADEATEEARALVNLVALLRDLLPEELRHQVSDLIRQVLLLVRAVVDWYLQRIDVPASPREQPPVVEDIPLD